MKIEIDTGSGFCFGVTRAIGKAEEVLGNSTQPLYCLGDIVHNSMECDRLGRMGLKTIDHEQYDHLRDATVVLRAHGEPPETYHRAQENHIEIIDATCPVVLHLQERIKREYDSDPDHRKQIVIFGKPGHAEVVGLNGQTDGTAVIVSTPDDTAAIDLGRPIRLYSQTTKSREDYRSLIARLREALPADADFVAYDTICNRVANRAKQLEGFARSVDVLIFVAGADSSNGHYLFEYCRHVQPRTYLISRPTELREEWTRGVTSVGISGATSTPRWLMEEVKAALLKQ